MPTIEFESTIAAPLEKVWAFYQDPRGALPILSPPEVEARVESADEPTREGSRVVISMRKGGLGGKRMTWVAKIIEHRPPHAVPFAGEEARFVDEQESGPFAAWRHAHEFEAIDAKTTRVVDRITYRVPFGPIGWIADVVFLRRKLTALFRYRHDQLRRLLEGPG